MACLHLLFHHSALESCLESRNSGDAILLIQDGAYAALTDQTTTFLALEDDIDSRGLTDKLGPNVTRISHRDMVQQVCTHQPIVSWR